MTLLRAMFLFLAFAPPALASGWEPGRTWVFAVGVIDFADKEIGGWPQEGRQDAELVRLLQSRGVPPSQTVFLKDAGATYPRILAELRGLLARTAAGDTLLFYYTGHGSEPTPEVPIQFLTYDYDGGARSLGVDLIVDEIEAGFKGKRVILLADACYTGSLCEEAAKRSSRLSYGCLASASSRNLSTGNWTFTEALNEALAGQSFADENHDGRITWAELRSLAEMDMALFESQMSGSRNVNGWSDSFTFLEEVPASPDARVGLRARRSSNGALGRVYDFSAGRNELLLKLVGASDQNAVWAPSADLMPAPVSTAFRAGDAVSVEWEGKATPATVLRAGHEVYKVRFLAGAEEWVMESQLQSPGGKITGFTSFESFRPKVLRFPGLKLRN